MLHLSDLCFVKIEKLAKIFYKNIGHFEGVSWKKYFLTGNN